MTEQTTKETFDQADRTKASVDRKIEAYKADKAQAVDEIKNALDKLHKIEEKSKCLRVQFLDWVSNKLLDWSNRVHEISARIDSPCAIKVEPRTRTDSNHYKESKEVARLREMLKKSWDNELRLQKQLREEQGK